MAFAWQGADGERLLVVVNYAPNQSQCYVRLPFATSATANGGWRIYSVTRATIGRATTLKHADCTWTDSLAVTTCSEYKTSGDALDGGANSDSAAVCPGVVSLLFAFA